jgi:transposase
MTKAYSLDLRERVARFVDGGRSRHAAAACFGVSVSFVVKLMAAWHATGILAAKPEGGWRYSKLDPHRDFLMRRIRETADITMPELAAELADHGTVVAPSSISRWLIRNGYRFKKNAAGQRARSAGHRKGARGMGDKAPAEDAARTAPARLHR